MKDLIKYQREPSILLPKEGLEAFAISPVGAFFGIIEQHVENIINRVLSDVYNRPPTDSEIRSVVRYRVNNLPAKKDGAVSWPFYIMLNTNRLGEIHILQRPPITPDMGFTYHVEFIPI